MGSNLKSTILLDWDRDNIPPKGYLDEVTSTARGTKNGVAELIVDGDNLASFFGVFEGMGADEVEELFSQLAARHSYGGNTVAYAPEDTTELKYRVWVFNGDGSIQDSITIDADGTVRV
jgi:hypothetical protein